MVSLGHGLECTRPVQRILLSPATEYAEWCTALLEGIFGEEAHLMRVKTTKLNPECKKFPAGFLLAAQVLHDEWLSKKTVLDGEQLRPYTPLEIAEKSKELPPYLAARSYSLYVQRKREAGELPPPQRGEASPTTPKRRYMSKGAVGRKRLAAAAPQQAPVAPDTQEMPVTWAPATTAAPEPLPGPSAAPLAPLPAVLPPPLQPVDAVYGMGDGHRQLTQLN